MRKIFLLLFVTCVGSFGQVSRTKLGGVTLSNGVVFATTVLSGPVSSLTVTNLTTTTLVSSNSSTTNFTAAVINTTNLHSTSLRLGIVTKFASYSPIFGTDYTILCDAIAGPMTISLPQPTGPEPTTGYIFNIKKIDVSANTVSINVVGGVLPIDGLNPQVLTNRYDSITVQSDGVLYYRIKNQ